MSQCWVYHPTEEAKIVDVAEGRVLKQNGWYDSPAKFPENLPKEELVLCETLSVKKPGRRKKSDKQEVTDDNSC